LPRVRAHGRTPYDLPSRRTPRLTKPPGGPLPVSFVAAAPSGRLTSSATRRRPTGRDGIYAHVERVQSPPAQIRRGPTTRNPAHRMCPCGTSMKRWPGAGSRSAPPRQRRVQRPVMNVTPGTMWRKTRGPHRKLSPETSDAPQVDAASREVAARSSSRGPQEGTAAIRNGR